MNSSKLLSGTCTMRCRTRPSPGPPVDRACRRQYLHGVWRLNGFCGPSEPFKILLVRDMWLTGFDAQSLHTMYVDKPMRGHGLMQAIARVNRVFHEKPGGLVVDYLGLAHELKQALATYTESGGTGETAINQEEAVAVMVEKYEICCGLFHGFDWSKWTSPKPQERLAILPAAQEHILRPALENGKQRLLDNPLCQDRCRMREQMESGARERKRK